MARPRQLALGVALALAPAFAQQPSADGIEFFESRIRPLLAAKCYACHSERTVASGELLLDTRDGLMRGGHRGPAVVPGDADSSLLVRVVSAGVGTLSMPPGGPLAPAEVADLREWVARGAPDPRGPASAAPSAMSLDEARRFWAFRPIRKHPLPEVRDADWPTSPIDRFLLAALEAKGLRPAPPADKRTLLRRVTFDLTGLPPTPRELDDFLRDDSPQAFDKVVERLLASVHYGERWGRHWLDLVRYAETAGHEFDQEKPDAWRYRDYVLRAFNQDLPFDRFLAEHIAGDLLSSQRLTPDGRQWDTPVATGFWGLGEERNAADDVAQVRADKVDNQIDVLGKAFLGLTVACARCHDHKFDPISNEDYYALAGVFRSSQVSSAAVDSPSRQREIRRVREEIDELNGQIRAALADQNRQRAGRASEYLLAAAARLGEEAPPVPEGLDATTLAGWTEALKRAAKEPDNVLYPFATLAAPAETPFAPRVAELRAELIEWTAKAAPGSEYRRERGDVVWESFDAGWESRWSVHGEAFLRPLSSETQPNQGLGGHSGGGLANSFAAGSDAFTGTLVSKGFTIPKPYMHVRLAGPKDGTHGRQPGQLRVELWSDGRFSFATGDGTGHFSWVSNRLARQDGEYGYFQIADRARWGHLAVDQIVLSDSKEPPAVVGPPNPLVIERLGRRGLDSLEALAAAYAEMFAEALGSAPDEPGVRALRSAVAAGRPLEADAAALPEDEAKRLGELRQKREAKAAALPDSAFALLFVEDDPADAPVHVRGDHTNLGETVPRRFLQVLAPDPNERYVEGSGRRELARAVADASNPLTARVWVNRVWQHHFGAGLVRTPDNFGATGERPTHPELLDTLAAMFVEGGWSTKDLHRLIVFSSAYRMASEPSAEALAADGDNRLLHHYPVRRIEAEAVRDSLLAVAGALDRMPYGPPVPPHISDYQDGRGKPPSGRLDGDNRRSVYIGVRRNFLTPLLLAFDYPLSVTTIGRRTTSTVPSQALALLNNEFVALQAERWADRMLAEEPERGARLDRMFVEAYARPVVAAEAVAIGRFLDEQAARYGADPDDRRVWTDLAHALFNAKEFLFLR